MNDQQAAAPPTTAGYEQAEFEAKIAGLAEEHRAAGAAIALVSLRRLATLLRAEFPAAEVMVLGVAEPGDRLRFEHADDAAGQTIASYTQVSKAGINADGIAMRISNHLGRDAWLPYAPYDRQSGLYRCHIRQMLDLPPDRLTTPAIRCAARMTARLNALEDFVQEIAAITPGDSRRQCAAVGGPEDCRRSKDKDRDANALRAIIECAQALLDPQA